MSSDLQNAIRIIVEVLVIVFLPVAAFAAIAASRLIWKRGSAETGDGDEIEKLRARVDELERRGLATGEVAAHDQRLAELEERVDFAERLLTTQREMSRERLAP